MSPGTYQVAARATVHQRCISEPISNGFTIGLFTSPPDADGAHGKELNAEGYQRQGLSFLAPRNGSAGGRQLSGARVSFGPIGFDAAAATHAVIFGRDDQVFAYGLVERTGGTHALGEIAFEQGCIAIRFLH